ncbi:hypothetical protein [Streptomyces sp. NPDC000877]|uniref:hypothetical protein n=1 Tax=unclassified Streptomyces TaxID=2593676 RepID=UPI00331BC148
MGTLMPPAVTCPDCAEREARARRTRNRLVTVGQSVIGTAQAGLASTGVWLFLEHQSAAAAAAAALTGLGFPVIKSLSKLRRTADD